MRRACSLVLGGVLIAIVASACEAHGEIEVVLGDDGSGTVAVTVVLDDAAVERIERIGGGPIARRFRIGDLVAAGWSTEGWRSVDGGAELTLTQDFATPAEGVALVEALSGDSGLVTTIAISKARDGLRDRRSVALALDLGNLTPGVADDADISTTLDDLGVDPELIDAILAGEAGDAVSATATVATGEQRDTGSAEFGEMVAVSVALDELNVSRALAVSAAGIMALAGLGALIEAAVSWRRRRPPEPALSSD